MNTLIINTVLIDFDNYFKKEIQDYQENEIKYYLLSIIEEVIKRTPLVDKIFLRLYGGWYEDKNLSKRASLAMQLFSNIEIFPLFSRETRKMIYGNIVFVNELIQLPMFTWRYTYKERKGISKIRVNKDNINSHCENDKERCPAYVLSSFTKSKNKLCPIPGCTNSQRDIFFTKEQKMVDTLIACDLIALSEEASIDSIFLVSNDMDHLPALAVGNSKNTGIKKTYLCISNQQLESIASSILSNFSIEIILLS